MSSTPELVSAGGTGVKAVSSTPELVSAGGTGVMAVSSTPEAVSDAGTPGVVPGSVMYDEVPPAVPPGWSSICSALATPAVPAAAAIATAKTSAFSRMPCASTSPIAASMASRSNVSSMRSPDPSLSSRSRSGRSHQTEILRVSVGSPSLV